jgi:heme exporter protein A
VFLLKWICVSLDCVQLQLESVGKTYGPRRVLSSISAELRRGDTMVVTGRNGAGKSTLLRIIAGLLRPSEGVVRLGIDGVVLAEERRRQAVGFVGPDVQLYRDLSAREHLQLVAELRGLPLAAAEQRDALATVGLGGREEDLVAGFSSGMQQRLRYALALLHRPRLLLLDEPTTNLDASGIAVVDRIVRQAADAGIVVIATNDPRDLHYGELVLALDTADHA